MKFKKLLLVIPLCMTLLITMLAKPTLTKADTELEPLEVGMQFPIGYEFTIDNVSNTNSASNTYTLSYEAYVTTFYWNSLTQNFVVGSTIVPFEPINVDIVKVGYVNNDGTYEDLSDGEIPYLEITNIRQTDDNNFVGIITGTPPQEPNVVYTGTFELLANLIYGGVENLTNTQIGVLTWFSTMIIIFLFTMPIFLFCWVLKLMR